MTRRAGRLAAGPRSTAIWCAGRGPGRTCDDERVCAVVEVGRSFRWAAEEVAGGVVAAEIGQDLELVCVFDAFADDERSVGVADVDDGADEFLRSSPCRSHGVYERSIDLEHVEVELVDAVE